MVDVAAKWTDPAPKYGPTTVYGECEADGCTADARTTCPVCDAHICFGHAEHARHESAHTTKSEES